MANLNTQGPFGNTLLHSAVTVSRDAHIEWLLDEALKETFPASDPIAVTPKRGQDPFSEKGS